MTKRQEIRDARADIQEAIESHGTYKHNIISLVLRRVARKFGKSQANALVREFDLDRIFGIMEEE